MNDRPLQLALRELRGTFTDPRAVAVILGVGIIAGVTGPFDTFDALALPPRLLYWIVVAFGTYGAGLVGATVLQEALLPRGEPLWLKIAILSLGASVPVTATVVALNAVIFPEGRFSGSAVLTLYFYCLLLCLALMTTIQSIVVPAMVKRTDTPPRTVPPLIDRLPPDARGHLRYLSMADHYVEVFTTRGKALVLMRLSDAIAETGGVEGHRVHRSHWVARAAISSLAYRQGRAVVVLDDGVELPVSRTYLSALRAEIAPRKSARQGGVK